MRKRFGQKEIGRHKKNRILVAEVEGKMVGLMVDAASEVLKLPASALDLPPAVLDEENQNYVTGVGKLNGRLIILIDLTKILRGKELRRVSELAGAGGMSSAAHAGS